MRGPATLAAGSACRRKSQEKNNKEIAAVIYQWLDKALPASQ